MLVTRPGEMADALNSWPTFANWKPKLTPTDNIWADSGGSVTAYSRPQPVRRERRLWGTPFLEVSCSQTAGLSRLTVCDRFFYLENI